MGSEAAPTYSPEVRQRQEDEQKAQLQNQSETSELQQNSREEREHQQILCKQKQQQRQQQVLLALRLPDGTRFELTLPASATLTDLFARVRASGAEYGVRDMSGGPREVAGEPLLELDTHGSYTLAQLGLRHGALLQFVPLHQRRA